MKSKEALERYVHEKIFPRISAKQREYLAQFFTIIFEDGFESGDFSAWTGTSSSPSIVTSPIHHGSYAMRLDSWGDGVYKDISAQTILYARCYFYMDSSDAANWRELIYFQNQANGEIGSIYYNDDTDTLRLRTLSPSGMVAHDTTVDLALDQWHCCELYVKIGNGDGESTVYINGEAKITVTNLDNDGRGNIDRVRFWDEFGYTTYYIDCCVIADTYIGEEGGVTEVQVLDSAAGTEAILRPYRAFSLTDAAIGQEILLKTRNLSLSDVAIGLETIQKARQIGTITDTAQGIEQILKQRLISLLDQATGSEVIARPTRIIVMADETLGQEILSKLRELAAITDSAIGMEYISAGGVGEPTKTKIFLFIGDLAIQITGD